MPFGDRTGPEGRGPLTGRGMGLCAGYDAPGYANTGFGFRRGMGRGFFSRGRGFGRGFRARWFWRLPIRSTAPIRSLSKEEEKKLLEDELREIELEKQEIEKRLKELR